MIKNIVIGMVLIVMVSALAFYLIFSPQYASSLNFNAQQIRIDRDQYAIPHIYAPDRRAFLYALGHLIAEDRLNQCQFRLLLAQGQLSKYLGQKTLKLDISMRDLSFRQLATNIALRMQKQDPQAYQDFNAYAQGINDGVLKRKAFPIQFYILGIKWSNFTVADIFTIQKLAEWTMSHNIIDEYTRSVLLANHTLKQINQMLPLMKQDWAFEDVTTIKDEDVPKHLRHPKIDPKTHFQPLKTDTFVTLGIPQIFFSADGSNAWVVSGKHTQSGRPLLVGDPHLENVLPSHWYQIKVNYFHEGREVIFVGVANIGFPASFGKNQYFASALTIINTDTQDIFRQKVEMDRYLLDGQWKELKVRDEIIVIKQYGVIREHHHPVRMTHRGPILNYIISSIGIYDVTQDSLSISWTGYNQEYSALVACSRSLQVFNFADLEQLYKQDTAYFMSINALAITADDHIVYGHFGLNPQRPDPRMGAYIKDGSRSEHDWLGIMPYQNKLFVVDPQSGIIVSANNRPANSLFQGGYFDHHIYSARATRLQQMINLEISSGRKITTQFAKNTLYDTVDIYCRQILPQIVTVLQRANQTIGNFSCDFKMNSYQATIYEVFFLELWRLISPIPENNNSYLSLYPPYQALYNYIHKAYRGDLEKQQIMKEGWEKMETKLLRFYHTSDKRKWLWGILHKDVATQMPLGPHPILGSLYNRQTPGWGNLHTVNVARSSKIQQQNFATTHRANYRSLFDFAGPSWWIVDSGTSENLLSCIVDPIQLITMINGNYLCPSR